MLVISFYTDDWNYPIHAERFVKECDSLGLRCRVEKLASTGSYLKNCCMKPAYIQQCLEDEKGPVLWVDVDGSILRYPAYFESGLEYDFQAKRMTGRKRTWHVGTMWWNYTEQARDFIERWKVNTGESSDESSLEFTWRQPHDLKSRDIPDEYFVIGKEKGVICHRLSSSQMKRVENRKAIEYERTVI